MKQIARITPEQVIEAYESTGFKFRRKIFYSGDDTCPLVTLAYFKTGHFISGFTELARALNVGFYYAIGFSHSIDGYSGFCNPDGDYAQGRHEGLKVLKALEQREDLWWNGHAKPNNLAKESSMFANMRLSAPQAMRQSPYTFYLTGSRLFGNAKPHSDWDFFVDKEEKCEAFLQDIGFTILHLRNHDYKDEQTIAVYRHRLEKIDVQIVVNAQLKEKAQRYILQHPYLLKVYLSTPSTTRDYFWNFLLGVTSNTMPNYGAAPSLPNYADLLNQFSSIS